MATHTEIQKIAESLSFVRATFEEGDINTPEEAFNAIVNRLSQQLAARYNFGQNKFIEIANRELYSIHCYECGFDSLVENKNALFCSDSCEERNLARG